VNPRTPVLVGAASRTAHGAEPGAAPEALELALEAVRASGPASLLSRVGLILVPQGTWRYQDPGGAIARAVGADARSVVGEIGVLQQTLVTMACRVIAEGQADAVLVVGLESKRRDLLAAKAGIALTPLEASGSPDETLLPDHDVLTRAEIERDLAVPAHQYAIVDNALRHADGIDHAAHVDRLGRLWAGFAAVAAERPDALDRSRPTAADITTPSPDNRMLATPYTKLLCSQWNVDEAVALLFAAAEVADADGLARDGWTFPVMAAESNHMTVMPARAELHRSPATGLLGNSVHEHVGVHPADADHLDLYSCFPAAVQVQARELGIDVGRPLTVTGGMTFFGGPLNSYVLHAIATVAERLRDTGGVGITTAVSGMLTKTGLGVWSSSPPVDPFRAIDVSAAAEQATELQPFEPDLVGGGRVVGATVVHDRGVPSRIAAVVESDAGDRTVGVDRDASVAAELCDADLCERKVDIVSPGVLSFT
jgi:acetyl-CoA C-acetyltransferase